MSKDWFCQLGKADFAMLNRIHSSVPGRLVVSKVAFTAK